MVVVREDLQDTLRPVLNECFSELFVLGEAFAEPDLHFGGWLAEFLVDIQDIAQRVLFSGQRERGNADSRAGRLVRGEVVLNFTVAHRFSVQRVL